MRSWWRPMPNTKPTPKPEPTPTPTPTPTPKPNPKPKPKPKPKPEPKPQPQPKPSSDPDPQHSPNPRPNPRPNPCQVAGDACTSLEKLQETLEMLGSKFKHVFYCAGNHELWCPREMREGRANPNPNPNPNLDPSPSPNPNQVPARDEGGEGIPRGLNRQVLRPARGRPWP
jgi:hypothetical protein